MNTKYTTIAAFSHPIFKNKQYKVTADTLFIADEFKLNDEFISNLDRTFLKHYTVLVVSPERITDTSIRRRGKLTIAFIDYNSFYSENQTILFFTKMREHKTNLIIIFLNSNWKEIVQRFAEVNILISGGSHSKTHMHSPVRRVLDQFSAALLGDKCVMQKTVESYFSEELEIRTFTKPFFDYTSKSVKESLKEFISNNKKNL